MRELVSQSYDEDPLLKDGSDEQREQASEEKRFLQGLQIEIRYILTRFGNLISIYEALYTSFRRRIYKVAEIDLVDPKKD